MNASVQQSIRFYGGIGPAYRMPLPQDYLARAAVQGGRKPQKHKLSKLVSPLLKRRRPRKRDRVRVLKSKSACPLTQHRTNTFRGAFIDLCAKHDTAIEVIDLTQDDDDDSTAMEPEKVVVFDTFAAKATDALRDQEVVQLLSDDTSIGTFELSVRDDSAHDGTMDWETLQDIFEEPSIVTAPQAQQPDIVVAHQGETMDIVEAPEDELNFIEDLLLQDVDGDNPVDSDIELEAMFGDTFAREPPIGAAAPTDLLVTAPQAQQPDIVVAHQGETMDIVEAPEDELNWNDDLLLQDDDGDNPIDGVIELEAMFGDTFAQEPSIGAAAPTDQCASVVTPQEEEEELRWDEELVSPDDFNSGLVVGALDGATFAGIFDDEPATVSVGSEEETPAVSATPDGEIGWDDQLAFLDSCWYNKNLVTPWEDGRRTSPAMTTAS